MSTLTPLGYVPLLHEHDEKPITAPSSIQNDTPSCGTIKSAGKLVPLRTLEELKAAIQTTSVYILPILEKSVNSVLASLRTILPVLNPLQHLRRLVKPSFLPPSVVEKVPLAKAATFKFPVLYMLVCPTSQITLSDLESFLSGLPVFTQEDTEGPYISIISVPSCQPISTTQAHEWSEKYWPTVYKRGNPYGPHPAIVGNAAKKLVRAGEYINIARNIGVAAANARVGERFGCVIVDPELGEVVVAAGDGRYAVGKGWGNPLNHSVMRAVAMVAQKRLKHGVEVMPENPCKPLTDLEERYFGVEITQAGASENGEGYLCHNMHVYISHEPCIMCTMALLHSRVGVVVFGQKVFMTGALMAEGENGEGSGYGMFWRGELNWKFLCWQWVDEEGEEVSKGVSV